MICCWECVELVLKVSVSFGKVSVGVKEELDGVGRV